MTQAFEILANTLSRMSIMSRCSSMYFIYILGPKYLGEDLHHSKVSENSWLILVLYAHIDSSSS